MLSQIDTLMAVLSSLISWRNLALVFAIFNLKNLPFIWHVRLFRHFFFNIRWRPNYPMLPKGTPLLTHRGQPTHPVFVSYRMTSRTPLLETDYNLHKSNSTYFTDLDIARTGLVTRIYSPGVGLLSKELDAEILETARKEGKRPPPRKNMYIALGSVYCSFKREIKPFELYEIETKVLAWDQKWMYVITFFLRPAPKKSSRGNNKEEGGKRTLLATAVSKYVVKKGRLTVAPERVLRRSGFLPPRPDGKQWADEGKDVANGTDVSGSDTPTAGITSTGIDGSLVREVLKLQDGDIPDVATLETERQANAKACDSAEWTWERVEAERLRGLKVLEGLRDLDVKLLEEWEM